MCMGIGFVRLPGSLGRYLYPILAGMPATGIARSPGIHAKPRLFCMSVKCRVRYRACGCGDTPLDHPALGSRLCPLNLGGGRVAAGVCAESQRGGGDGASTRSVQPTEARGICSSMEACGMRIQAAVRRLERAPTEMRELWLIAHKMRGRKCAERRAKDLELPGTELPNWDVMSARSEDYGKQCHPRSTPCSTPSSTTSLLLMAVPENKWTCLLKADGSLK
ncbi:hypothetical protein B0H19DRAFT_1078162 [Mycena capillaripes]|nr:hypothetical protein B0H19DRAFT_1078162 [Mycena capillaripes]